jgi:hypothetical protein
MTFSHYTITHDGITACPQKNYRMPDQIFMKFGMEVMPFEASRNLYFLISYN